ncbi:hypothetical protein [Hyphomicrobium sp. LHD-15]|uniref:hypothetical protein n=1 Tax=Hyphomicrobium sp. LHD-15 TaxID=3072142 RepID=UPI00280FE2A6|nr:hypothetical protein [Hyphomicrobium sp. LHD-15]MDQ8699009.1 hypothetical protein [Hyphomicrobium sp. LHD-15]
MVLWRGCAKVESCFATATPGADAGLAFDVFSILALMGGRWFENLGGLRNVLGQRHALRAGNRRG